MEDKVLASRTGSMLDLSSTAAAICSSSLEGVISHCSGAVEQLPGASSVSTFPQKFSREPLLSMALLTIVSPSSPDSAVSLSLPALGVSPSISDSVASLSLPILGVSPSVSD